MESPNFDKMDQLILASLEELSAPVENGSAIPNPAAPIVKRPYKKSGSNVLKRSVCQVVGCEHALLTAYSKKYRVCNVHVKSAEVNINDDIQRFCQKCSRFHPTAEFDGYRRTCRIRLAQHNTRRRLIRAMQRADREASPPHSSGEDYPPRHNIYRPREVPTYHHHQQQQQMPPEQYHPILHSNPVAPMRMPSRPAVGGSGDMHAALLQVALAGLGPDSSTSPSSGGSGLIEDLNKPAMYDPHASYHMPPPPHAASAPAMYRPTSSAPQNQHHQMLQQLAMAGNSPEAALLGSVDPQQLVQMLQLILSLQQMGCSLDQLEHPEVLPLMMSLLQTA